MLQQSPPHYFLTKTDWIELLYEDHSLHSPGFNTSQIDMRVNQHPLNCIFMIEYAQLEAKPSKGCLQFNQSFMLKHVVSGRYLCYNQHFATKSELFLRNTQNQNCHFVVKPLYKCQTLKHMNVRDQEECCLAPASAIYSNEKVGLVVAKQKGNNQCLSIAVKKNEQSPLRFVRRSTLQKKMNGIYTLHIYQLKHSETKLTLSKTEHSKLQLSLSPDNKQQSFLMLQRYGLSNRSEIQISNSSEVYIRFFSNRQYLGFSESGYMFISGQPNSGSLFVMEAYSEGMLQLNAPIKIKHQVTAKYLAIRQNTIKLQRFTPFNTWQFNTVPHHDLANALFLNDSFEALNSILSAQQPISSTRRQIKSILKQSINYCYKKSKIYEHFQQLEKIQPKLKYEDQLLFAKIGYLPLLEKLCGKIVDEIRSDRKMMRNYERSIEDEKLTKEMSYDKEEILVQALVLITAICKENKQNLAIFCSSIRTFIEFIGVAKGTCQLLFQLFGYNLTALDMFEHLELATKKSTMRGIELIVEYLLSKEFSMAERIKVVKLLRSLLQSEHGDRISTHQQILIESIEQNRLNKILLPLSTGSSHQLIISMGKKSSWQLLEFLSSNMQLQIQLLSEQLKLMVALCRTASEKHIELFRDIVSEEMIKKYLKEDLGAQFLSIFMQILIDIYLGQQSREKGHSLIVVTKSARYGFQSSNVPRKSNYSSLKTKLLQHEVEMEMQDVGANKTRFLIDTGSLKKIKQLIVSELHKDIESRHTGQDVVVYLVALRRFLQLDICNEQELKDMLDRLTRTVRTCLESGVQIDHRFLMEYLRLVEFDLDMTLQKTVADLLQRIKKNYNAEWSRLEYAGEIVELANEFMAEAIVPIATRETATTLQLLLASSLSDQKSQLFLKSGLIYQRMANISINFIDKIKKAKPIESPQSFQLLQKLNQLISKLEKAVGQAIHGRDDNVKKQGRRNMLSVLEETCQVLTDQEDNVNILAQQIVQEFGFLQRVVQFITQKKEQLHHNQNNALFTCIFKFITLFLRNCEQNFELNEDNLLKLKLIYKYVDRGQVKLLYQLTTSTVAVRRQYSFLLQSWLAVVRSCEMVRLEIPIGLMMLLQSWGREQEKHRYAGELVDAIVADESLLCSLLKIGRAGQFISLQVPKHCDFKQQWIFYILLVLKLLRYLLEWSTENKEQLTAILLSHIPLRMMLNLIEESFKLQMVEQIQSSYMGLLLKSARMQFMGCFLQLYKHNLAVEEQQIVLNYLYRIHPYLAAKYIQQPNNEAIAHMLLYLPSRSQHEKQIYLKEMMLAYIGLEYPSQNITAELINKINNPIYLSITVYYQFCFNVYDILKGQDEQDHNASQSLDTPIKQSSFSRQLQLYMQTALKQYKQVINQKLNNAQFAAHSLAYSEAIKTVEEITKQTIDIKYKVNESESEDEPLLMEGQQFFEHREVKFILDSYLSCTNKSEKYLYESLLIILYNRRIKTSNPHHIQSMQVSDTIKFILAQLKKDKLDDPTFMAYCKILNTFLQANTKDREWQAHLQFDEVMSRLAQAKQDRSNRLLTLFLQTEYKLMENYFGCGSSIVEKYKQKVFGMSDGFQQNFGSMKERIRGLLQQQRMLYHGKKLLQQAKLYFEQRRINNTFNTYKLSTQLILKWLQFKLRYSHQNIQRYFDLIIQVVMLLKTYTKYLADFQSKYLSQQLQSKIKMCLRIIFYAVTAGSMRVFIMLLEYQIWDDFNLILQLDDSLTCQLKQIDLKTYDLIKMLTREKITQLSATYIQGILQIYNNSASVYGQQEEAIMAVRFPLIPIKAYYQSLKTHVVAILQEFRHNQNASAQLLPKLNKKAIENNIITAYDKYKYLYDKYTIAVIHPHIQYQNSEYEMIATNINFQNAVKLLGVKMQIDQLQGNNNLSQKYGRVRMYLSKQNIKVFVSLLKSFVIDLVMMILAVCMRWVERRAQHDFEVQEIYAFFMNKLGRVQVMWQDRLYSYEFMIYPQCKLGWSLKQQCLDNLNFASNQLKRQSILTSMNIFILQYQNELTFQLNLWKIKPVIFISEYMRIFRLICFAWVLVLNFIMLTDNVTSFNFGEYNQGGAFEIIAIINAMLVLCVVIVELLRRLPLAIKLNRYNLEQGVGFLSRGYASMSRLQQNIILVMKILLEFQIVYRLIYLVVTFLTLWNKIFASLLLLDLIFRIPAVQSLMNAVWKPRYKILLVIIAYIVIQYFFSILLFFFFVDDTNHHCDTFGNCFIFVFATRFKAINGFVGYLFQQNFEEATFVSITIFGIFQDLYVIIIHLVVLAILYAVIVNSFVLAKAEETKQRQSLRGFCIVCNIDRNRFNLQNRANFKSHKAVGHNLFNYFDFKYRLNKKKQLVSDLEMWVLESRNNDWIPDNRARELQSDSFERSK